MSQSLRPGANEPDDTRGPEILGACITVTVLAFVAVSARIYVRVFMIHSIGIDDYVILLALALSVVGIGLIIPEVINGGGRHIAYLDPAVATVGLHLNFITQGTYMWCITLVKISIAFFLLRIAPTKFFTRWLYGVIIFLMCFCTMTFLTLMLQCKNLAAQWDPSVKYECWAPRTLRSLSYTNQTVGIFTDFMLAFLPIPMLWHVQINKRTKASLMCIMALGVFASVASIVKLSIIPNYGKTGDFLWDSAPLTIWTVVECNVGMLTACLPCLKPLFKRVLESSWAYGSKTRKNTNDHGLSSMTPGSKYHNSATVSRGLRSQKDFEILDSTEGDLEANRSEESILPLQTNAITKTTVVTVDRNIATPTDKEEQDLEGGRRAKQTWERRKMEFSPERRVEDRV